MNCEDVRQHWQLYYDSEGDAPLLMQLNEHLQTCAKCAKWYFQQSQLEDRLRQQLGPQPPSPQLWRKVLVQTELSRAVSAKRWLLISAALTVAAGVLILFGVWRFGTNAGADDLAKLSVTRHAALLDGREAVEFASKSDHEVEDYLRRRVTFAVRCPPRKDAGFDVRGGGVCKLADDEAAYVLGEVDGRQVSVFILPRESLLHFPHQQQALMREKTHQCREGDYQMVLGEIDRNIVLVIGQLDAARLLRVLRAYGTYPEDHANRPPSA